MDPQFTGDIFKHLEKQNELLKDAYNSMSQELHKLQVEEEMLMRKFYELMTTHGLTKRNEGSSKVSNDEEMGHHTALLTNTNSHISNADDDKTENHTTLDTKQQ
ncbi:hypothetical protein K2173_014789 [Erythroxylum novogranatense]|uniref:Uncharacterized protein n=1 Tax=Erythroxylum novogranatense TaxID=1862640 RepID=A0AAV8TFK0_9ROSI|nr:hypothetical protein K2173_014789 [Erythroxylum novogranatense]